MNRTLKSQIPLFVLVLCVSLFTGIYSFAADKISGDMSLKKATTTENALFNGNRISSWMSNTGFLVDAHVTGNSGMEWPYGSNNTIDYQSGLWIAGKDAAGDIRTACAEYSSEFLPGVILPNGSPDDPDKPEYRIYTINSDGTGDWDSWPVDQGAPVDANGDPALIGDQTQFYVMNDADTTTHSNLFGTLPMGIEIQTLVFGFNRKDALGDMMFIKWVIINKSQNDYSDVYIGVWDDPDLGDASDDLVACDTTLSLGYCYNGVPADATYGVEPPAIGFDFFQGPKVGDEYLGMSGFVYYWNGAPDPYGDPEDAGQMYNFMQGLASDGSNYVDNNGNPGNLVFSGDPILASGWVDQTPGDRRFLISSGPFSLAAGDTQVVVGAKLIAQGSSNLSSVGALKFYDAFAQSAFDNNFELVNPPKPNVTVNTFDGKVVLTWEDQQQIPVVEDYTYKGYDFEGYNVYQGESPTGPWKLLQAYDLVNDKATVYEDAYDSNTGWVVNKPTAFGPNQGIERRYVASLDYITGNPLYNYRNYYYAVTSYTVALDQSPKVIESGIDAKKAVPGVHLDVEMAKDVLETVSFTKTDGISDSRVEATVIDPAQLVDATYTIEIHPDPIHASSDTGQIASDYWTLKKNGTVLEEKIYLFEGERESPIYDGVQFKVYGLFGGVPPSFSNILIQPSGRDDFVALDEFDAAKNFYDISDYQDFGAPDALAIDTWGVGSTDPDLLTQGMELRFTGEYDTDGYTIKEGTGAMASLVATSPYYSFIDHPMNTTGADEPFAIRIPFEVWNMTTGEQVNIAMRDRWQDPSAGPIYAFNPDDRMYTWFVNKTYTESVIDESYDDYWTWNLVWWWTQWETGDVLRFLYPKTIKGTTETYSLTTEKLPESNAIAKTNLDIINAVPNPYFGFNSLETTPTERIMRITNLPGDKVTIRIFDLAGNLIKIIDNDARVAQGSAGEKFAEWDLRNNADVPVASGLYLVYVEIEGVGSKILKVAVVNRDERLLYY